MRFLLLALPLLSGPALAQDQRATPRPLSAAARPICENAKPEHVRPGAPARLQKLDELPPANLYLSVLRIEDGCDRPVMIRERIGGTLDSKPAVPIR